MLELGPSQVFSEVECPLGDHSSHHKTLSPETRSQWLQTHIMPHEPWLRKWLVHSCSVSQHDVDDIIQEAFLKLLQIPQIDHIENAKCYLKQTAWSIVAGHSRRRKCVQIDPVGCETLIEFPCHAPNSDEILDGRIQLAIVEAEIDHLSDKMRRVFLLRRIHCVSQRDTAELLSMSESSVEKISKVAIDRLAMKCGRRD